MLLNVLLFGDETLRKKAGEVPSVTSDIRKLAGDMLETMYYHDGLGLAAPQVGVSLRLCVMDVPREGCGKMILINPAIRECGAAESVEEGCLSFPEIKASVARAVEVAVEFTDLSGKRKSKKVSGLTAQAVQHELDNLDGVLLVDRMGRARRAMLAARLRALRKRGERGEHR